MGALSTRLGLALARRIGRHPPIVARKRTRWLASPMQALMRRRAAIVQRNLELCFPERDRAWRDSIARLHFRMLAETAAEIAVCWTQREPLPDSTGDIVGLEHLEAARARGGVMLLTGHFTSLELGGRLFAERVPLAGVYRPLRNARLNTFQNDGRGRYTTAMIPRDGLRSMVRHLRDGGVLWYAPDQDFGPDRSTFVPFFGVETATLTGLSDLARMGRASIVHMAVHKALDTGRLTVTLEPTDAPVGAPMQSVLASYNAFLERQIRIELAQYWWVHRRFKTAPPGHAPRYPR